MNGAPPLASAMAALAVVALAASVLAATAAAPIDALVPDPGRGMRVFPRRTARAGRTTIWVPIVSSRRAARRRAAFDAEVPQLLDLLAAGSSAGLQRPSRCGARVKHCVDRWAVRSFERSRRSIWEPGGATSSRRSPSVSTLPIFAERWPFSFGPRSSARRSSMRPVSSPTTSAMRAVPRSPRGHARRR